MHKHNRGACGGLMGPLRAHTRHILVQIHTDTHRYTYTDAHTEMITLTVTLVYTGCL